MQSRRSRAGCKRSSRRVSRSWYAPWGALSPAAALSDITRHHAHQGFLVRVNLRHRFLRTISLFSTLWHEIQPTEERLAIERAKLDPPGDNSCSNPWIAQNPYLLRTLTTVCRLQLMLVKARMASQFRNARWQRREDLDQPIYADAIAKEQTRLRLPVEVAAIVHPSAVMS
jgi:hypothetical protein